MKLHECPNNYEGCAIQIQAANKGKILITLISAFKRKMWPDTEVVDLENRKYSSFAKNRAGALIVRR